MPNPLITIGIVGAVILVTLIVLGLIISRMYNKSEPKTALIRTGGSGPRIITNGGVLVIGMIHELTKVNMETLGLEIKRNNDDALITVDRMRVDVGAKFFVRVKPNDEEAIMAAATTLGDRMWDPLKLREMVEDKLVDALRAVAATMTMDELHENRAKFVQDVQNALAEDLLKNGLELESVSLTAMDQTPFENLDENNAFNAVGMQKLAEVIATSKKRRAEITADSDVKVAEHERNAETQKFAIQQDIEEKRISKDRAVAEAQARASAEQVAAEEAASRSNETARIEREQAVEVADQNKKIAINVKSMEESKAKAEADTARAEARTAEEAVITAGEVAAADRRKKIEIIAAEQAAEKQATGIRVAAAAKKEAAADEAEAVLTEANAKAEAQAAEARGIEAVGLAQAKTKEALVGAENNLSSEVIAMKIDMHRIEALPGIVAEMVRPAEMIDSITLHNVTGLGSGGSRSGDGTGGGAAGGVTDAIMDMALKLPIMKKLGEEAGINIAGGLEGVMEEVEAAPVNELVADVLTPPINVATQGKPRGR